MTINLNILILIVYKFFLVNINFVWTTHATFTHRLVKLLLNLYTPVYLRENLSISCKIDKSKKIMNKEERKREKCRNIRHCERRYESKSRGKGFTDLHESERFLCLHCCCILTKTNSLKETKWLCEIRLIDAAKTPACAGKRASERTWARWLARSLLWFAAVTSYLVLFPAAAPRFIAL